MSRFTITIADQSETVMTEAARQCINAPAARQCIVGSVARSCAQPAPVAGRSGHDLAPLA